MDDNKAFWERFARFYAPIQEHSNRRLYAALAERCGSYITGKTRVLELACGSGQLSLPLYERAAAWEATDFSPKMIAALQKRCPALHTSVQDATRLPYGDGSFSLVLIGNALHIMPRPEKALAEAARVLTDDGILLAPTFVYEGKVNRLRMRLTTMLGFRTYCEWKMKDLTAFLENGGFRILEARLLPGSPLPVGFVAAKKVLPPPPPVPEL